MFNTTYYLGVLLVEGVLETKNEENKMRVTDDVIKDFVTELEQYGIDDATIEDMIESLKNDCSQIDIIRKISIARNTGLKKEQDKTDPLYVLFSLNNKTYAINIAYVLSVAMSDETTYPPGFTHIRDELIKIVNLRALLSAGMQSDMLITTSMLIIVKINDTKLALVVDEILGLETLTNINEHISCDKKRDKKSSYIGYTAGREKSSDEVLVLKPECLIPLPKNSLWRICGGNPNETNKKLN